MQRAVVVAIVAAGGACSFHAGDAPNGEIDAPIIVTDAAIDSRVVDGPRSLDAQETCMQRWGDGTVAFGSATALATVNIATSDQRDPFVTSDDLTLYMSSDRPVTSGGSNKDYDIYMSTRATPGDAWSTPMPQAAFNTTSDETKMSLTSDATIAVVASDRSGGIGQSDVWYSTRANAMSTWGAFTETHMSNIDTVYPEYDPQLSGDGLRLYYAPATTGQNIAESTRTDTSSDFPESTLLSVNAGSANSADPALSPDETLIVFSSNRATATDSGTDGNLFYATRASLTSAFGAVAEIPDVDTTSAEGDPVVSADGCELYFSSTRDGGFWQLYVATQTSSSH